MTDLSVLIAGYKRDMVKVIRKAPAMLAEDIAMDTPKDTGTANASWTANKGGVSTRNDYRLDGARYPQRGTVEAVANSLNPGDTFSFANGLPYIRRLEYGYSPKAPNGMLRRNVARWQQIVDAAARGI